MASFYDVLRLPFNASKRSIRKAYYNLAMQEHPDKGGSCEKMKKVNEAYEAERSALFETPLASVCFSLSVSLA